MNFTFLGTAGAFSYPEPFCRCENCIKAQAEGGKSLRKRSAALINTDLLIDMGPDVVAATQQYGLSLSSIQYCLQTHAHFDHLDLSLLLSRSRSYGESNTHQLHFYASPETLQLADKIFQENIASYSLFDPFAETELNLKLHAVQPLHPVDVGAYRVIPFPANHDPGSGAMLYAIENKTGKSIFYGTDTEALFDETWQGFLDFNLQFDMVVLDHTCGVNNADFGHMNAQMVTEHIQRMRSTGILKSDGAAYITHISHRGNPPHDELVHATRQNGYLVAYDGLVAQI